MMRTGGVIYVFKRKIDGRDYRTRIAKTRNEFMNFGGRELERAVVEECPTSRQSMLELIKRSRQRQNDSIIAVSTWKEVANLNVARALINGGFSVIVADLARDFHLSKEEEPGFVCRGPVMEHALEMSRKLQSYVDGRKTGRFSAVNEQRARAANAFALNIWPAIEQAAKEAKTANQSEIAAILGSQGLNSINGYTIKQSHILRYIGQAGKEAVSTADQYWSTRAE